MPTARRGMMAFRRCWRGLGFVLALAGGAAGWVGCIEPPDARVQREARSSEPNDTFDAAIVVRYDAEDTARLAGYISLGDVDVYDLGGLAAGDRIAISVAVTFGSLIPTTAVFDADSRLIVTNPLETVGDRSFRFSEAIRHDSGHYYLGIAEEWGTDTVGAYSITVRITRGGRVPRTHAQVVVLDFDGGHVVVEGVGTFDFEPFSARALGFAEDQTGTLKELIQEAVEQNFAGYDVTVLTSDDEEPEQDYSVVHFGGFDQQLFGISQTIDAYNRDPVDEAVIFTESFLNIFSAPPSLEQMATALGNVATHEFGHLLGLNHTADPNCLMDSVSPPDSLLEDQEFIWTLLARQIFPIGTQDSPLLLSETVGFVP